MKVKYSEKAIDCITKIGSFLDKNNLSDNFIKNHLLELKLKIDSLLTAFPESGKKYDFKRTGLRQLVVNNYSVLYKYSSDTKLVEIAYIYKHNLPKIK